VTDYRETEDDMAEIKATKAGEMSDHDARCLLNWRDWTHEELVYGLNLQQLLDLYHASAEYVSLEGWLEEDRKAPAKYRKIAGKRELA
jgi:hypothetical protein